MAFKEVLRFDPSAFFSFGNYSVFLKLSRKLLLHPPTQGCDLQELLDTLKNHDTSDIFLCKVPPAPNPAPELLSRWPP